MFPYARPARLALHALAFLELLSSVTPSFATPMPLPLPLMMADYSPSLISVNRSMPQFVTRTVDSFHLASTRSADPASLAVLQQYLDGARLNAANLQDLASQSSGVEEDDYDFQRDTVTQLNSFNTNMEGFQAAFADVAASNSDKGLANYDRSNDLETLLKDYINLHKEILNATVVLVYNIPVLGPTLGPVVYNIKCLIDEILNQVEDFADDLINKLQAPLQALLGKAVSASCKAGVEILGLCI